MDRLWWRILTKCGPLEMGMENHFSNSCLENPMNSMKKQKGMTLEDEPCRMEGVHYVTGEDLRNSSRENEVAAQSRNYAQLWTCLVVKVESDAVKKNIA